MGLRLQHPAHPGGGRSAVRLAWHPARSDPRRRRHGDEFGERGQQRAAATPLPLAGRRKRRSRCALLSQYTYLTTVAAAAIAVGVGLIAASYTTTAQRGMNGSLAWTESAGMPMRPSMSTMMTPEIPPVDAAEAGVHVQIIVPAGTRPGLPARVVIKVTDAR